ncbi:MAG: hypothetical protein JOZ83_07175 [Silvibacterium sp.]|nr:hypothetical protein [Silvibacterium sp.]
MPGSLSRPRFPFRLVAVAVLTLVAAGASWWYMRPGPAIDCNRMPPLAILATLAAFLIAIVFRHMARYPERAHRWFLTVWLFVAAATLFADFRYVRRYRVICRSLQQQFQQFKSQ